MEMDEEFLETYNLDWFASCPDGQLAHFATGGRCFVPMAVRRSLSIYENIYDYFLSVEDDIAFEIVEGNLPEFSDSVQRERYLRSFVDMARKGLFSYDVSNSGGYSLIAKPQRNRRIDDLPLGVRRSVHVLRLRFSVRMDESDLF
ncbi:hypothetical protein [Pseudomonas sp. R76]|uniref:hypothetical protein n=1 Tax=Pseudomonas sp. R76 TaxID=1573711 RepID=UPI0013202750|nr:hypothetical protein [Pseudomonas sp. R76]QHD08081.1 hypothetical protein PspR76_21185 [Pseudomonas sp. R76]